MFKVQVLKTLNWNAKYIYYKLRCFIPLIYFICYHVATCMQWNLGGHWCSIFVHVFVSKQVWEVSRTTWKIYSAVVEYIARQFSKEQTLTGRYIVLVPHHAMLYVNNIQFFFLFIFISSHLVGIRSENAKQAHPPIKGNVWYIAGSIEEPAHHTTLVFNKHNMSTAHPK